MVIMYNQPFTYVNTRGVQQKQNEITQPIKIITYQSHAIDSTLYAKMSMFQYCYTVRCTSLEHLVVRTHLN